MNLRVAANQAEGAGNTEEAERLNRQADLLEDAVTIYRLWSPPRQKLTKSELFELVAEATFGLTELQDRSVQTTCPICMRHISDEAESFTRQIKHLMELVNES